MTATDVGPSAAAPEGGHWAQAAGALRDAGVPRVYGLPGDDMAAARELLAVGIPLVVTSEQRTAAYAAAGDAAVTRADGGFGVAVVVAGRGPGAAALVPPLLELLTGGCAVLVLVGGAPEGATARTFQSAPQEAMLAPVSVAFRRVGPAEDAGDAVREALARLGRAPSGPVVVEIPDGAHEPVAPAGAAVADPSPAAEPRARPVDGGSPSPSEAPAPAAVPPGAVLAALRPVVLVGGGARGRGAAATDLAHALGAPLLCTASGRGVVDEDDASFWGLSGLYLHPVARRALQRADLLIVVGSRMEETATEHLPPVPVVRVDLLPGQEATGRELPVTADAGVVAGWAMDAARRPPGRTRGWGEEVARVRAELDAWRRRVAGAAPGVPGPHRLGAIVAALGDALPADAVVVHENGSADMWSYLHPVLRLPRGAVDIAPSEQTTLGFGVAAAAGAARASDRPVIALCGDGAFAAVAHDRVVTGPDAPGAVYVVFDDGGHGWLEQQHRDVTGVAGPVFTGMAPLRPCDGRGAPLPSRRLDRASDAADALSWALAVARDGPAVILVPCADGEGAPVLADTW